ncbi:hypothetical protein Tsubulata_014579 [Turnera subulata]|uniref:SAC3/GANP/THP3 conserved domain-containing protein n=1 Tax=Turnera subulata TaxID=218843 RepID=A0A9Q0GBP6_9ROSI|nr:hypothetical protein Tsubulata_014579 [Turnera subulata]
MTGFGKEAGPTGSSLSQPRFGPPPSSSPPPPVFPQFGARVPEAVQRPRSPPLAYQSSGLAAGPFQSTGIPRRPEVLQRVRSPPSFESFRPSATAPYPSVAPKRPNESPLKWVNPQRPLFNGDVQTSARPSAVTSFVASRTSGTSVTATVARLQDPKRARSPPSLSADEDLSRNYNQTSPQAHLYSIADKSNHSVHPRTFSFSLPFDGKVIAQNVRPPLGQGQWPAQTAPAWENQLTPTRNSPKLLTREDRSSALPRIGYNDFGRISTGDVVDVHASTRTRSPPRKEVLQEHSAPVQKEYKRPSMSPPRLDSRINASDSPIPQKHLQSTSGSAEPFPTRSVLVTKRTRSPPLPSTDRGSEENSHSNLDGSEREIQAKAKRLARFKEELGDGFENSSEITDQKLAKRHEQSIGEKKIFSGGYSMDSAMDLTDGNASSDFEGLETSSVIIGLCPDMCPESERAERERKGDLDQYERLDGDRNQTDQSLAVKKYTRTAEREAILIRPMPILKKTIDYLLNLLDQPYDDKFLGIYNFLWDRMRAIRMDLRMQHIFNQEAITMLEQMIRLHVSAMHELCEYTKGEGFSEGFDAHLNIEQMNKTSVELFQMYDDHRKKGLNVATEKEFRGYYALLKLDKHPGYKVEPSELSLDLAKMTPEIRQTSEVLFARDVARACRTGNFIIFFRLARKATYLQACLMHAHFAKVSLAVAYVVALMLRTQALASLYSGLQNNQGLPVACIAEWLAMEEEDIYSLLEYHGFSIKEFEEPYMVKEGPFLNGDSDYPTKCSQLVHLKKSRTIVGDVSPPLRDVISPAIATKGIEVPKIHIQATKTRPSALVKRKGSAHDFDHEMSDFQKLSSPKVMHEQPPIKKSMVNQPSANNHFAGAHISPRGTSSPHSSPATQPAKLADVKISPWSFSTPHSSSASQPAKLEAEDKISPWGVSSAHSIPVLHPPKFGIVEKADYNALPKASPERTIFSSMQAEPLQIVSRPGLLEKSPSGKHGYTQDDSNRKIEAFNNSKDEQLTEVDQENENNEVTDNNEDEQVAQEKLKLIIRLWKRRSSKLKVLREQRQIAADAALSSLSLGPPIRQAKNQSVAAPGFDIDHAVRERFERHGQSWSRLNVSDVTADILGGRNPDAQCLCWKILCCQVNSQADKTSQRSPFMPPSAGPWLFSKLIPSRKDNDSENEDLLVSSPGLAIWRTWISSQHGSDLTCCLSVVKDVDFSNLDESVAGASAIVFLISESIPWSLQKVQLHDLLTSIPSGSSLPLLILSGSCHRELSDASSIIISELGLRGLDKTKISSFLVVFLVGDNEADDLDGFFSDRELREGLRWLASGSPLQPDLHCTKMRDLVLSCLNPSLAVLESMNDNDVGPNHCISAFNEALDWAMGEIEAAAKANPSCWPCPEIALLEDSCNEHLVAQLYLPRIGWSSATGIEQLLRTARDCKLPSFPDAVSWLDKSANIGSGIGNLLSELETSLIRYLTESSKMMGFPLAAKEAHLMLQRNSRLELCDSSYRVIPKWVMLLRRVFSWRLASLVTGALSSVYILRNHHIKPTPRVDDVWQLEASASSPYLSQPTLDEVIDAGCRTLQSECNQSQPEAFQPPYGTSSGTDDLMVNGSTLAKSDGFFDMDNSNHIPNDFNSGCTEIIVSGKKNDGADKLSKLLEQCNILQNSIDAKLSIYY